jgi:hypothetical protein
MKICELESILTKDKVTDSDFKRCKELIIEIKTEEQKNNWKSVREEVIDNLSNEFKTTEKPSWRLLIEHIRAKLAENDNRLMKRFVYLRILGMGTYLQIYLFISIFLFLYFLTTL